MGDATAEVEYSIKQAAPTVNDSIIGLGGYDVKCFFYPKNEYSWAYAGSPTDVGTYVVRFKVQGNGNYAYTSERLMDESWKSQTKVIEGSTLTKAATIAVDRLRYGGTGGGRYLLPGRPAQKPRIISNHTGAEHSLPRYFRISQRSRRNPRFSFGGICAI
ncbi:MAG: hypothetical protein ACLUNX_08850 [Angelakisella sp.]